MFSKKNRLAKSKDISLVYARGRAFFSPYFSVKVLPTDKTSRFTVVVSTKVSKLATRRNAIKRHLRESLKQYRLQLRPGDYIVTVRPQAANLTAKQLREEMEKLLVKTKLV